MILKQLLNNNSLVVEDGGREMILIGRGIAFGLSKRQLARPVAIPEERIEKRFIMENGSTRRLASIIRDIPYKYVLAGDEVIQFLRENCSHELSDSIYLTLIDHVNVMVERIERGMRFDAAVLGNIGMLYREEYSLGMRAVDILRRRLHLDIDDTEANYIALHIVNAEMDLDMSKVYEVASLVEGILSVVHARFEVDVESRAFDRFVIHCRLFAQRVVGCETPVESHMAAAPYQTLAEHYPEQEACVDAIAERIEARFPYVVTDEEKLYLLMHLVRLTVHRDA